MTELHDMLSSTLAINEMTKHMSTVTTKVL